MTVYMVFSILVVIVLIDAPFVALLMYVKKQKSIDIIGTTLSLLTVLIGVSISIFFHWVHTALSGNPAKSPLFYGLAFTAIAAAPFITITYMRLRTRGRQGHCINCDYDLRGSIDSETCPECGERIIPKNLNEPRSNNLAKQRTRFDQSALTSRRVSKASNSSSE